MLRAGLIGFPSSGKTSLFQLLTSIKDTPPRGGKSDANVEFDVVQEGTKKTVLHGRQPVETTRRAVHQLTLQKTFSANELEPGIYRLKVHVRDQIAKQGVEPEAVFAIE